MNKSNFSVLNDKLIKDRLDIEPETPEDWDKKLIITPILDINIQLGPNSFDLRLGTEFSLPQKIKYPSLDPLQNRSLLLQNIRKYETKLHLDIGDSIILHPKEFILGSTLEYIKMPSDLFGIIENRSSWGRLGIFIALARFIEPGFIGMPTLEIFNSGTAPIKIYPGLRVAQIIFLTTPPSSQDYHLKKYHAALEPEFSKLYDDKELDIFKEFKKP
ncbi:MAG: dCTP deaminase [Candidatus Helarchaeota archaeon]